MMSHFPTPGITSREYRYFEAFPHTWVEDLQRLSQNGVQELVLSIPWGIHEPIRGHCDFQKSARLRVEKLLSIAQESGLRVKLKIGLSGRAGSLPEWAEQNHRKSSIPFGLWEGTPTGFVTRTAPLLVSDEVVGGFVDFCGQLFGLISLYSVPDGPVSSIELDLTEYLFASDSPSEGEIAKWWESRFVSVEEFNRVFGMSFSSFSASTTTNGLRQLVERRPWLCTFEFRQFLENRLQSLKTKVLVEAAKFQLTKLLTPVMDIGSAIRFYVEDSAFVERRGSLYPICPWGIFSDSVASSLGIAEVIWDGIASQGYRPSLLSEFAGTETYALVFCGKNLSGAVAEKMMEKMNAGLSLFFPFGLPVYDERMRELPWFAHSKQEPDLSSNLKIFRRDMGLGGLSYPVAPLGPEVFGRERFAPSFATISEFLGGKPR